MLNLFTLVLQLAVVLAVCRLVGEIFLKIHQPRVVGEMFAGIMLGPSLAGLACAYTFLPICFPLPALGFLNALSSGRRCHLHVPGGPGNQSQGTEKARPCRRPDQPCQHYRSVRFGGVSRTLSVSTPVG